MLGRVWISCVFGLLTAGAVLRADETLRIVPIVSEKTVVVSFELADAYSNEIRQAISSGLRTTFTYDIELRMVVPGWVDKTIATATVSTSDEYDNLTRRHTLSRLVDGRVHGAVVSEDDSAVKKWLTTLNRVPLCETAKLDPERDYYVRISARAKPRGASIIGWANAVTGQAKFTFIP
ncbi:MAG: DUF4390 domain-containing protein [Luteitalea sp.]|nr:DUF4390 domain-containing protein [Luteitalea sp.]